MYKIILIDKNVFDKSSDGNRYIDTKNLFECLKINKKKIYLIQNISDKREILIPTFVKDVIEYSEYDIVKKPYDMIIEFIKHLHVVNFEEVLIISSNQLLLKLFEKTSIKTWLINAKINSSIELSSTHESYDCESVKTMVYK